MNDSDARDFLYNDQCLTCMANEQIRGDIHRWFDELGKQWTEISRRLLTKYEYAISPDAISNHLTKHYKQPSTNISPMVGVVKPPKGWEPKLEISGDKGELTSTPQGDEGLTDFSDLIREAGENPDDYEATLDKLGRWQTASGDWRTSYKINLVRKTAQDYELSTLFEEVRAKRASTDLVYKDSTLPHKDPNKTLVIPFADLQVGKTGSRGGTIELIDRIQEKKEKLLDYITTQNCEHAVIVDAGDIVENFENTKQQMFTNDRSLMQQLDLAGTLEEEFIELLAKNHTTVKAGAVPSNHGAWRSGKDNLGKPSDDWGIFILRQIEKSYTKYSDEFRDVVSFHYPDEWRKSMTLDVQGIGLGLVHGDDVNKPESIPDWWAKQVHGGGPLATADILVSGHFHTFRFQPSGRNPYTGRQKWWVASPTLDNGSDWYANGGGGGDSDPGLLSFVVEKDKGLDFQSFTIL